MATVLIYVQHLLGIGHLMRMRLIAEALADSGLEVHMVTGGVPVAHRLPRGVHTVQLPPIAVTDASFKPLRDADGQPITEAFRQLRKERLCAAYDEAAPAAVLFESFPFGRRALRFELLPLLERIEATPARPRVLSSVRDILQLQTKTGRDREMLDLANRWFDAILVHGDPRFTRFEGTFPFTAELRPAVRYTGFVRAGGAMRPTPVPSVRSEVLVSVGGGAMGVALLDCALDAQSVSRLSHLTWRLLVGGNVGETDFRRLAARAGPRTIVERAREDFPALLEGARVSISQAGYNTAVDVVTSGARTVLVPFASSGETEQRARAELLEQLGLAIVLDETRLSPETLAHAVNAAGFSEHWGRWDFESDGAARSAAIIGEMIASDRRALAKV